jgi:hypothetical protein
MIYAIETQGRAVALTEKSDAITRLNTDQYLRDTVIALRSDSGKPLWDGVSTFLSPDSYRHRGRRLSAVARCFAATVASAMVRLGRTHQRSPDKTACLL